MRDIEKGKLHDSSSRRAARWLLAMPPRPRRLLLLVVCMTLAGLVWIVELHRLLWYTMHCEYLSHRDARFVSAANNYQCLSDVQLADTLRDITFTAAAAFAVHNVTYFLESGTLLGAFREQGVIRHDTDVDLGIDTAGLTYLRHHAVELPDGYVMTVWNSPLFPDSTRDAELPVRITHTATALYADVFAFHDWPHHRVWQEDAVGPLPSVCFKHCKACAFEGKYRQFTVPKNWVYPLVDCLFEGHTFKCPRESAKYLEHMYGKNYMTPS